MASVSPSTDTKSMVCVLFPGRVEDVDAFMPMIGGHSQLEKVFNSRSDRLELRFRPKDVYSHAVYGDKVKVEEMLVRVKRKTVTFSDGSVEHELETRIIGTMDFAYHFSALCDLQYLPMCRSASGGYESLVQQLMPQQALIHDSGQEEFHDSAPLLILPAICSRFDVPVDHCFRSGVSVAQDQQKERQDQSFKRHRKSRATNAIIMTWSSLASEGLPIRPKDEAVTNFEQSARDPKLMERVKGLFDEFPVITRNKLLYLTSCTTEELRLVLPVLAYNLTDGPFRKTWIRFGFDPRTEGGQAVGLQVVDFRVRGQGVTGRRIGSQYQLPLQSTVRTRVSSAHPPAVQLRHSFLTECVMREQEEQQQQKQRQRLQDLKSSFSFEPNVLPTGRQILCQLLDIQLDFVKQVIAAGPQKEQPDERDGWLSAGTIDSIRDHMSRELEQSLAHMSSASGQTTGQKMEGHERRLQALVYGDEAVAG